MEARLYRQRSPEADSLRSHLWPILTPVTSKSDLVSRLKAVQNLSCTDMKTVVTHDRQSETNPSVL